MTTTPPGFTVTTTVRVIDRTGVDAANTLDRAEAMGDILIPGDWRMICARDDDAVEWGVADCRAC